MPDKVFQKPAQSQAVPHRGALRPRDFATDFQFTHYDAPLGLERYVAYIWVISWNFAPGITRESLAVLPNPQINAFFSREGAGIQHTFQTNRTYRASGKGCVAGITFQPGGFYGFWPHDISQLSRESTPITDVFPQADDRFTASLLRLPTADIYKRLEALLLSRTPVDDPHIAMLQQVITAIEQDQTLTTVQAVAAHVRKSERTLQQLFRRYGGIGVKWMLLRKRLLNAAESTRQQATPDWAAIAFEMGYSSQAHFITDFKRVVGMTPTEYVCFVG